jgi:hypothetical protein
VRTAFTMFIEASHKAIVQTIADLSTCRQERGRT